MKKKLMKRLVALSLAGIMLCMSACGKAEEPAAAPESSTTETTAPAEKEEAEAVKADPFGAYEETIRVNIGVNASAATIPSGLPGDPTFEKNAVRDYFKDHLNIEYENILEAADAEDYNRLLSLAMTTGDLPDVFTIYSREILEELAANDLIEDLTEVFDTYASEYLVENLSSSGDPFGAATVDGKLMAVPRIIAQPENWVFIRLDWADAAGITIDEDGDYVISPEELKTIAATFVEKDPGKTGNPVGISTVLSMGNNPNQAMTQLISAFGVYPGWYLDEGGNAYYGNNVPEAKDALTYLAGLYKEGILDQQIGSRTAGQINEMLANGQLGIFLAQLSCSSWFLNPMSLAVDANARWGAFALGNAEGKLAQPSYDATNRWVVVRKGYEHPEVAVKIENVMNLLRLNYDKVPEENKNEALDAYNQNGAMPYFDPTLMQSTRPTARNNQYQQVEDYRAGKLALEEITDATVINMIKGLEAVESAENYAEVGINERTSYHDYVTFKASAELQAAGLVDWQPTLFFTPTETYIDKWADLVKLEQETWYKIISGELSVDAFDAYVEDWNARGGEQIAAEIAEKY